MRSRQSANDPKNVDLFCRNLLQSSPNFSTTDYHKYFAQAFRDQVSFNEFISIFTGLNADVGHCVSYEVTETAVNRFSLSMITDQKMRITFRLGVDQTSGLFTGLLLDGVDDPSVQIQSWDDVDRILQETDPSGKMSATLVTSDGRVRLTKNPDEVFGIGSTFKLYILGALERAIAQGQHSWSEELTIQDAWKSLPSGTMQNLPAGTQLPLLDFATKMISISDNTAADHLLQLLGRSSVESMLSIMGNEHASLDIPFPSTAEIFKLKWAVQPSEAEKYIRGDAATRESILDSLASTPLNTIGSNGVDPSLPTDIDSLEWFATTPTNAMRCSGWPNKIARKYAKCSLPARP